MTTPDHPPLGPRVLELDYAREIAHVCARLKEILSRHADPGAVLDALPDSLSTPELQVPCAEGEAHALIGRMAAEAVFPGALDIVLEAWLRTDSHRPKRDRRTARVLFQHLQAQVFPIAVLPIHLGEQFLLSDIFNHCQDR